MNNNVDFRNSLIVEDGEVTDLVIRFTGNLNGLIKEYFKNPKSSQIHEFIYCTLEKAKNSPKKLEDL